MEEMEEMEEMEGVEEMEGALLVLEAGGGVHQLARRQPAVARLLRDRLGRLPLRVQLVPPRLDLRVHRVLRGLQQVLRLALEAEGVLLGGGGLG